MWLGIDSILKKPKHILKLSDILSILDTLNISKFKILKLNG